MTIDSTVLTDNIYTVRRERHCMGRHYFISVINAHNCSQIVADNRSQLLYQYNYICIVLIVFWCNPIIYVQFVHL